MMNSLSRARKEISKAKYIVIAGHRNPDGDSIGSLLSLGLGLEKLGKQIFMVSQDSIPERYSHLPGANRIIKKIYKRCDLAIAVDCSNREILGRETFNIFKQSGTILEIDHHEFRRPFGRISLIDTQAAAVGELVYLLLSKLKVGISKEIAQNLLTSIIVETNSFRLPKVRAFTFQLCSELLKKKIDFYELVDMVYWSVTPASAILTGICLARCKFLKKGRMVWSQIRAKDFNKAKGKDRDGDAIIEQMRSVKGVEIAVLFREKNKETLRVSLRSKGKINIASIAENYNGGGHFDIAGCNINNSPESIRELLGLAKKLLDSNKVKDN